MSKNIDRSVASKCQGMLEIERPGEPHILAVGLSQGVRTHNWESASLLACSASVTDQDLSCRQLR